jgi:hypothetical protein
MNRYFYKICCARQLDNGVRQSVQFTMTQISDSQERAEFAVRRQLCEQYFDWEVWVWEIDLLTWAAIKERENGWALKLVRMKTVKEFV